MDQDQLVKLLNELIERNKDSTKAFVRAERDVTSEELSSYFDGLAAERAELVDNLEAHVLQLGAEPEDTSTAGGVKRGWMNIKAAMTIEHEKTDAIVVSDLAEQEAELVSHYQALLEKELPADLKSFLGKQYDEVRKVQHDLARLKRETAARAE